MKMARRLLSLALAIAVAVSCVGTIVFADETAAAKKGFSDVANDQVYSDAVEVLSNLKVINGYPDGTFGPDKNVTRAEFTAMLMRVLNLGNSGAATAAGLPFTDVEDTNSDISWAIPNINTAYGMGVINGYEDLTFRPSANVAFEEAVKMIVCTLGYGTNVDTSTSPWYANYIAIANQIGVTKTATEIGAVETPASRACIAQLLYDSLDIEIIENEKKTDRTILKDYLGLRRGVGVVSSDGITSLTAPDVNLRSNEVQIYGAEDRGDYEVRTYKAADDSIKDYLGYEIEYYFQEDGSGDRTLVFSLIQTTEDDIVTINAAKIEKRETTNSAVKYYENKDDDKAKTITLDTDNVVIYNGKLYGPTDRASRFDTSMIPTIGEIKFIDSDSNGRYEMVIITAYDIYYVSSKDTTKVSIVDNVIADADKKNLALDVDQDRNLYIVDKNGKSMSYSSIANGNIICYATSRNDNGGTTIKTAIVLTDKVTGKITASNGDGSVTIAGKNYFYSNAAPWMSGKTTLAAPQIQDSGTYCLDLNGDIVAYTKDNVVENVKYGYVTGYSEDRDSFDGIVTFRVFTSTGGDELLGTYRNTTVNGVQCATGADVLEALKETATNPGEGKMEVQQLIKYTTRTSQGETVFDKIVTASGVEQGQDVTTDTLTTLKALYTTIGEGGKVSNPISLKYNGTSRVLVDQVTNTKVSVGSATVISVPEERDEYSEFRKTSASSAFKDGKNYVVEVFDLSKANVPKIVVIYGADNSQAVDALSPVYAVAKKDEATKGDDLMHRMEVFKSTATSASSPSVEWISNDSDSPAGIEPGDIFRVGVDKYGDAVVQDAYMIYDMDGTNTADIVIDDYKLHDEDDSNDDIDINEAEFVTIMGSIVARDDNTVTIADKFFTDEEVAAGDYDTKLATNFDVDDFASAIVLIYNTEGQVFEMQVGDYSSTIAGFASYTDGISPTKVLVYMTKGKIKMLCVLPQ